MHHAAERRTSTGRLAIPVTGHERNGDLTGGPMTQPAAGAPGAAVQSAQGQDRSDYQAVLPWAGDSFGFAKATEGLDWQAQTFAANWANLKAAGIPRGAYHFFHPELDAVAQAQFFLSVVQPLGLEPGDMLVVDSETFPGATGLLEPASQASIMGPDVPYAGTVGSPVAVGQATRRFLETLHAVAHPHNPRIVYTYLDALPNFVDCKDYQLWVAYTSDEAPPDVSPWQEWRFWQWGGAGEYGLSDAFNGTQAALTVWRNTYLHPGAGSQSDQLAP
jgi:lysozyme